VQRWLNDRRYENCRKSLREARPALAHIFNECPPNHPMMTKRHNRFAEIARRRVTVYLEYIYDQTSSSTGDSGEREDQTSSSSRESEKLRPVVTSCDARETKPEPKKQKQKRKKEWKNPRRSK
jgi:hypothetical protein